MRYLPIILISILITGFDTHCENELSESFKQGDQSSLKSDSVQIAKLVYDFFAAFDSREIEKIEKMLHPNSVIIHNDGVANTKTELLNIIKSAKKWSSRKRKFKDFTFHSNSSLAFLGFINEVTFPVPNGEHTIQYQETWIFVNELDNWYPLRIHYTLVTKDKHSEG